MVEALAYRREGPCVDEEDSASRSRPRRLQGGSGGWFCGGMTLLVALLPMPALGGDFGITGVLDVPTARMRDEGDLSLTYSRNRLADNYVIGYQPLPWLETAFRYTIFNPRDVEGSTDELFDRSFEIKARLLREGYWVPEVAIGIRDLVGTGAWNGEYLVANKQFGSLDLSMGLGWGRFADRDVARNPLRHVSSSFNRRTSSVGLGGTFSFGDYFAGPHMGMFGSAHYRLPFWNLSVLAAYNSDSYQREQDRGTIDSTSPWSFGVDWEPVDDVVVGVSWAQDNHVALRFSATISTRQTTARKPPNRFGARGTEPAPPRSHPRRNWYQRISNDAHSSGLTLRSAKRLDEDTINIVYSNHDYQYEADAVNRLLSLSELYAPRDVSRIILTNQASGSDMYSVHYTRRGWEPWAAEADPEQASREPTIMPPLRVSEPDHVTEFKYPSGGLSFNLGVRPYLFDPDSPFRYQVFARLGGHLNLGGGWSMSGSWIQDLYNDFGDITRESDSVLPKVRSEVGRYLRDGTTGIDRAVLMKRGQLADEVHYLGFAGILEDMYSGIGGEVLYRPFGSRFGFGANIIGVQQRDYDRSLSHRDYRTVIGHASIYWASPIHDFDVALHAGRYLARDLGATFEVQKRFANGWSVGVFATLTDVPFDDFGEGSFDKGLIFRIPLNPYVGYNTRGAYSTILRPIQRDGGQRLGWGTMLWDTHRSSNYDFLSDDRSRMVPQ